MPFAHKIRRFAPFGPGLLVGVVGLLSVATAVAAWRLGGTYGQVLSGAAAISALLLFRLAYRMSFKARCSQCQARVDNHALFCSDCGARFQVHINR